METISRKYRDPFLAILFSCLVPGLGQVYCGYPKRGILFLLFFLSINGYIFWAVFNPFYVTDPSLYVFLFLDMSLTMIIIFDGFFCAKRINAAFDWHREASTFRKLSLAGVILVSMGILSFLYISLFYQISPVILFKTPTKSMATTLNPGDLIVLNRWIYLWQEPKRGDIIAFHYPKDPSRIYVKRLVGFSNEEVEIKDNQVLIDQNALDSPAVFKEIAYKNIGRFAKVGYRQRIPVDNYYVLGDNSPRSKDSRFWGFVPKKLIVGKAYKIIFPFNRSRIFP